MTYKPSRVTCGVVCIILSLAAGKLHSEEQCLKDAWVGFNSNDYQVAIEEADKCIDKFAKAAAREQAQLDQNGIACPPTGSVSDAERNKIFKRGLLNDVATSYFIKGRSAEYLYEKGGPERASYKQIAERSYKDACQYKCGRSWDPRGWFWSPCQAADDRLPIK